MPLNANYRKKKTQNVFAILFLDRITCYELSCIHISKIYVIHSSAVTGRDKNVILMFTIMQ